MTNLPKKKVPHQPKNNNCQPTVDEPQLPRWRISRLLLAPMVSACRSMTYLINPKNNNCQCMAVWLNLFSEPIIMGVKGMIITKVWCKSACIPVQTMVHIRYTYTIHGTTSAIASYHGTKWYSVVWQYSIHWSWYQMVIIIECRCTIGTRYTCTVLVFQVVCFWDIVTMLYHGTKMVAWYCTLVLARHFLPVLHVYVHVYVQVYNTMLPFWYHGIAW